MKRLFTTIVLAAFVLAADTPVKPHKDPANIKRPRIVIVDVDFGKPPDCRGWGVCEISFGVRGLYKIMSEDANGEINNWTLVLPRQSLLSSNPGLLTYLEGKSTFSLDDSYTLPSELCDALGVSQNLILKANVAYPMEYQEGEYRITIPVDK